MSETQLSFSGDYSPNDDEGDDAMATTATATHHHVEDNDDDVADDGENNDDAAADDDDFFARLTPVAVHIRGGRVLYLEIIKRPTIILS